MKDNPRYHNYINHRVAITSGEKSGLPIWYHDNSLWQVFDRHLTPPLDEPDMCSFYIMCVMGQDMDAFI